MLEFEWQESLKRDLTSLFLLLTFSGSLCLAQTSQPPDANDLPELSSDALSFKPPFHGSGRAGAGTWPGCSHIYPGRSFDHYLTRFRRLTTFVKKELPAECGLRMVLSCGRGQRERYKP